MNAPQIPANFYPDEPQDERIARWLTLEAEAAEMQRRDVEKLEEPRVPRPYWMRDCTNEDVLMMRGYM